MYFIIFSLFLLWLILGFIAFLKEARDEKCVVFDNSCVDEFILCLILGPIILLTLISLDFLNKNRKGKNLFIKFIEWSMRLVQKKEK